MIAYIVSDAGSIATEDEPAWQAYLALVPSTIKKYGGRYLSRGGFIDVIKEVGLRML